MLAFSAVAIVTPLPSAASRVLHHSPAPRLSYAVPHLRCAACPAMSMPLPNIQPLTRLSAAALVLNAAASATNGLFYLTPLRSSVLRGLFGIDGTDSRSPVVGAFQFLGGLHAAIAIQCVMALAGLRSWKEMLVGMAILHIFFDTHHVKHLFSSSFLQKYNFFLIFLNLFLLTMCLEF